MQVFLGAPYRALIAMSRHTLGSPCRLLLPSGATRLVGEADHEVYDWHGFLRALTGVAYVTLPTPEMIALLGEVCEQILTPQSYFGKVRHSPRFHSALAQNFCRWSLDGLTPDLLEQGAQATLNHHAALAELDDDALQDEWRRKTSELTRLWRAWQRALEQAGLPEPIRTGRALLQALGALDSAPPLLLAGFTELTALDLEALRLLDSKTQVGIALLYDPAQPDKYAPSEKLRQLLQQWGIPIQEQHLASSIPASAGFSVEPTVRVVIHDTPNLLYEVETVAREVLRLQQEGFALDEIALLVRQPESILETLEVIFTRYGIPIQGEASLALEQSWRVRWLMEGLRLLSGVGIGEQWLQWLEHPAHALDAESLRGLRHQIRRHLPAAQWFERALQRAADPDLQRLLHELNTLRQMLATDLPQTARRLILRLNADTERSPDLTEWLRLIDAYARLWRQRTPAHSIELLERLVSGARFTRRLGSEGVRLLPMEHADLLGARAVFVLQVLEGTLPRHHPDDPFLREAERVALNQALQNHRIHLPTRTDYQAGEPMLFQRALHTAQERLHLSYSRTQSNESDALPSFYLEELKEAHGNRVETRFYRIEQIVPEQDECLHPYDQSLREPVGYIEPAPYLRRDALRAVVAHIDRRFSITELETLARCPFEHFARYILHLRSPQRELSVREVGTLTHNALCRAVRQAPSRANAQEWIESLTRHVREILLSDTPDLPEWQVQVLHALAQRLLRRFGGREPRYQAQFGVAPFACEWAFGDTEADDEERTLTEPLHNQQAPRAVAYRLNDGREIQLRGVIDRIDLSPDRRVAMVLDYKLGSAPSKSELTEGREIQGLLYLHAVRTVLPNAQVVLAYDRLKAGRRVRFVPYSAELAQRFKRLDDEDPQNYVVLSVGQQRQAEQRLRNLLTQAIAGLRAAVIEPVPGEHCRRCPYGDLCRRAER
jgi:RecB family exonuclease